MVRTRKRAIVFRPSAYPWENIHQNSKYKNNHTKIDVEHLETQGRLFPLSLTTVCTLRVIIFLMRIRFFHPETWLPTSFVVRSADLRPSPAKTITPNKIIFCDRVFGAFLHILCENYFIHRNFSTHFICVTLVTHYAYAKDFF